MEQDFGASHLSKMDADQQGQFQIRVPFTYFLLKRAKF